MNKERRLKISQIIKEIEKVKDNLQSVLDDEQFAFDNMPENLQYSMRGEDSQKAIEYMDDAIESLDEAIAQLEGI